MAKLFNRTQRRIYGEKAVEFSFLSIGALIFGQFLSEKGLSLPLIILGLTLFITGSLVSYLFLRDVTGGE